MFCSSRSRHFWRFFMIFSEFWTTKSIPNLRTEKCWILNLRIFEPIVDFGDITGISQQISRDFERESVEKTYGRHGKLLRELRKAVETSHMCIVTVGSAYGASVGSQGDIGFSCKSTISNRRGSFRECKVGLETWFTVIPK